MLERLSPRVNIKRLQDESRRSRSSHSCFVDFLQDPLLLEKLQKSQDEKSLRMLITSVEVEKQVIERVRTYIESRKSSEKNGIRVPLEPAVATAVFEGIIELTKKAQIMYLLHRPSSSPYRNSR